MAQTESIRVLRCSRCGGRMLSEGDDGDSACFSCGNVVYRQTPLAVPILKEFERRPSRGGQSLF